MIKGLYLNRLYYIVLSFKPEATHNLDQQIQETRFQFLKNIDKGQSQKCTTKVEVLTFRMFLTFHVFSFFSG